MSIKSGLIPLVLHFHTFLPRNMVKFTFSVAAVLVAALSSAQAHYQLTYPAPRGPFSEDNEPIGPCATYNVTSNRTEFPLSKGFMEINSEHVQYTYSVHLVLNNNPGAADFTAQNSTVSNGTNNFPEQACLPVDLSKYSNIADGTNATLQIVYNAGDSILYEVWFAKCFESKKSVNPSFMKINFSHHSALMLC